jgi:hypothetical protein
MLIAVRDIAVALVSDASGVNLCHRDAIETLAVSRACIPKLDGCANV